MALASYALLTYPVYWGQLYVYRELLRFSDWSGLTTGVGSTTGALGGPIQLYTYQRQPVWFRDLAYLVAIFFVNLPALGAVLWVYHRWKWGSGRDGTRCGPCGAVLQNLIEPRCPACGERL